MVRDYDGAAKRARYLRGGGVGLRPVKSKHKQPRGLSIFEAALKRAPAEEPNSIVMRWDQMKLDYGLPGEEHIQKKDLGQLTRPDIEQVVSKLGEGIFWYKTENTNAWFYFFLCFIPSTPVPVIIIIGLFASLFMTIAGFYILILFIWIIIASTCVIDCLWNMKVRKRGRQVNTRLVELTSNNPKFSDFEWSCDELACYIKVQKRASGANLEGQIQVVDVEDGANNNGGVDVDGGNGAQGGQTEGNGGPAPVQSSSNREIMRNQVAPQPAADEWALRGQNDVQIED